MRIRGRMGPLGPTSSSAVGVTRRSATCASGTVDEGRQVHQDLQDGPAEDRDLRVVGRHGAVHDLKLPAGGIEAQQLPDGQDVRLDARVHLLPQGHQHGLFAIDPAHPETDRPRELDPAEPLQEDVELRVRGPRPQRRRRSGCRGRSRRAPRAAGPRPRGSRPGSGSGGPPGEPASSTSGRSARPRAGCR